jgi:hypothetical protein
VLIVWACVDLDFDCVYQQSASSANTIVSKEYSTTAVYPIPERMLTSSNSYIGQLESRLLAVENLLAQQASLNQQLRSAITPSATGDEERERRSETSESSRFKRKRDESPVSSVAETGNGEMLLSVRQGHLQDDSPAPETVLDGMGNLGDEEDYGYFGG